MLLREMASPSTRAPVVNLCMDVGNNTTVLETGHQGARVMYPTRFKSGVPLGVVRVLEGGSEVPVTREELEREGIESAKDLERAGWETKLQFYPETPLLQVRDGGLMGWTAHGWRMGGL